MLSGRAVIVTPLALLATRVGSAAAGKMVLCIHSNTSAAAGSRRALEGWAKAGITPVELYGRRLPLGASVPLVILS